jgi:hypothetical protein
MLVDKMELRSCVSAVHGEGKCKQLQTAGTTFSAFTS